LLKLLTKDERTELQKNYEYAKTDDGGGFKGSLTEFKNSTDTGDWNNYQKAKAEGYKGKFQDWIKVAHPSSSVNISPFDRESQVLKAKRMAEVLTADYEDALAKKIEAADDPALYAKARTYAEKLKKPIQEVFAMVKRQALIDRLDEDLKQVYGDDVDMRLDGWYLDGKLLRRMPK
jgi:hypothetical protein